MTLTVGDTTRRLAAIFNFDKAAGWDPVGLQFGDPSKPAARVAVCHEVTNTVTDSLIAEGVDLAVSYHPLLFRPTRNLVAGPGASGRAFRLIAAGVSLLTVHTAFDVLPGGTADSLAGALGLSDVSGFGPAWGSDATKIITFVPEDAADDVAGAMVDAGAGRIGSYTGCSFRSDGTGTFIPDAGADPHVGAVGVFNREPEIRVEMIAPSGRVDAVVAALSHAHPYEEPAYDVIDVRANAGFIGRKGNLAGDQSVADLAGLVAQRLGGVVRVAGGGPVHTVAVIPGSGGSMLGNVTADVVVTGDVGHHQARDAVSRGVNVIDPGHAATERPGVQALYAAVAKVVGTAIDLTDIDPDPWKEP